MLVFMIVTGVVVARVVVVSMVVVVIVVLRGAPSVAQKSVL